MKVKQLIEELKKVDPNRDVIFWDKEDNWDINFCQEDDNNQDLILFN